jgi:lauroyl/myristoyl acyltransferase
MDLQTLANSRFGVSLTLWIGRNMPLKLSYRLVDVVARMISNRDTTLTRTIKANQWVARGENSSPEELNEAVYQVLVHAGCCFADFYRDLTNPQGLIALSPRSPNHQTLIDCGQPDTPGAFVVAPHLSAFDIALLALAYHGLHAKVLTYGNPTGGYEIQNQIRASTGLDITPVRSEETHLEAVEWMRAGGVVITAVDRPIRRKAHTLTFFDHPSPLPAGHIRMALEARVPVLVVAAHRTPDRQYHIKLSAPIVMQRLKDKELEIRQNAEKVLTAIETFIREAPEQWLMYYPVWPDLIVNQKL